MLSWIFLQLIKSWEISVGELLKLAPRHSRTCQPSPRSSHFVQLFPSLLCTSFITFRLFWWLASVRFLIWYLSTTSCFLFCLHFMEIGREYRWPSHSSEAVCYSLYKAKYMSKKSRERNAVLDRVILFGDSRCATNFRPPNRPWREKLARKSSLGSPERALLHNVFCSLRSGWRRCSISVCTQTLSRSGVTLPTGLIKIMIRDYTIKK